MPTLEPLLIKAYKHDLIECAKRIGYDNDEETFDLKFVVSIIEACDHLSNVTELKDSEKQRVIAALGLVWENCREKYCGINVPILALLSRIGYLPNPSIFSANSSALSILDMLGVQANRIIVSSKSGEERLYFTPFQRDVWNSLNSFQRVAISAPTSAGKTFVITRWMSDEIKKNPCVCIFITPSLTLCNQIAQTLKVQSRGLFSVKTNVGNELIQSGVYVITQEKALANSEIFKKVKHIVIDEIQNVERFADDNPDRSLILLEVIDEVLKLESIGKIIVSGPMISNIGSFSQFLFEKEFTAIENKCSPVIGITHSFSNSKIGCRMHTHLANGKRVSIRLSETKMAGLDSLVFAKNAKTYMAKILDSIPDNESVIVFAGSTSQANSIADSIGTAEEIDNELSEYCAITVSSDYSLTKCLKRGVAFHHSKIPTHLRRCIEIGFLNGDFKRIVATTTLLQGVNFPAKHIIIRNPSLGTRADAARLTEYEQSNLRGRAGRLFKDFVGRSYLLNEDAFTEDGQLDLFPQKQISNSLESRFQSKRDGIIQSINSGESNAGCDQSMLALIASKICLSGNRGLASLDKMGIRLSDNEVNEIKLRINSLGLDKAFHSKFKRIDPFTLKGIQSMVSSGLNVPDINQKNFANDMIRFLKVVHGNIPEFIESKIGIKYDKIDSFVYLASSWANGNYLSSIIKDSSKYYRSIDDLISTIQSSVVYRLTQALSPFMYLQERKSLTIESFENGSKNISDIDMIGKGMQREVAIRYRNRIANHKWDRILIENAI